MIGSAPRLETDRLILRSFTGADLDALAATLGDAQVVRFLGVDALSREESFKRILIFAGQWQIMGMGMWAVEAKADGRLVGHCGFFDMQRDMEPSIIGEAEMGWIFDRSVHGQGIAQEACRAALGWFEEQFEPQSIPAIIAPRNGASMKLAERLGFDREPDGTYRDEPIAIFRRPAWR